MAEISAQLVKELREKTGAGMMDCKKALAETAGDFAKAEEHLRKKGLAAAAPLYVKRDEVPADVIAKEIEIAKAQMRDQKKPEAILEKIALGKVEKYYEQFCLLDQPFVKEDKKKVSEIITDAVAKIGENIQVRRFARFVLGEGLEKKQENLAEEVAKQAGLKA